MGMWEDLEYELEGQPMVELEHITVLMVYLTVRTCRGDNKDKLQSDLLVLLYCLKMFTGDGLEKIDRLTGVCW
jgi:hypothetical protein